MSSNSFSYSGNNLLSPHSIQVFQNASNPWPDFLSLFLGGHIEGRFQNIGTSLTTL